MPEQFTILALPFLACLILPFIQGYLGLHVRARAVIFVDIARAQAAVLWGIPTTCKACGRCCMSLSHRPSLSLRAAVSVSEWRWDSPGRQCHPATATG